MLAVAAELLVLSLPGAVEVADWLEAPESAGAGACCPTDAFVLAASGVVLAWLLVAEAGDEL